MRGYLAFYNLQVSSGWNHRHLRCRPTHALFCSKTAGSSFACLSRTFFQRYLLFNYRLRGQTWVPRSSSHCETICLYDGLPQQVHCDTICLCELLDSGYQGWWYVKNLGRSHMSRIRYKTTCLKPPYFWDERSCLKPSYSWDETNGRKPPYSWGETKCLTLHNILLKRIVGSHHASEMKRFVFMMVCLKPIVNRFVFIIVCLKNA